MTETTPLGRAVALALAKPGDDATRLRLYEVLSGAELTVTLAASDGDAVTPVTDDGGAVIAHDRPLPGDTASLSGLALAQAMAGQGAGLALRTSGGDLTLPPEAMDWLARTLGDGPAPTEARPVAAHPPAGLPLPLLTALDRRLAQGEGMAEAAWLAAVDWSDGTRGHLLAVVDARPGAEEPIAAGIHAAVALSGAEGVRLDVTFLAPGDPVLARLAKVGLRFDMTRPESTLDPQAVPNLR